MYKSQIQKMEEKLEESKQEIVKGNSIIQKQQADHKSLKQKLKLKTAQMEDIQKTVLTKDEGIAGKLNQINELKEH